MPRFTALASAFCAALALGVAAEAVAEEALAAAGFSYRVTTHTDMPGGDFLGTYASSQLMCATYCSADARCVAYTYLSKPIAPGEPTCWLKSNIGESTPMDNAMSGVRTGVDEPSAFIYYGHIRGTDEPGITRVGEAYAKVRLTDRRIRRLGIAPTLTGLARDAAACSQLCDRDERCRSMTVRRGGSEEAPGMCHLMEQVGAPTPDPNTHASVKLGPPPPLH